MPNNLQKLLPTQSGELTVKHSVNYTALLRSQLDYSIFVYRSARRSYLKELDSIHHQSLRLVLGAFTTFPIDRLYTEAHKGPLQIRSDKLTLQYYTKLKSCPSNPAYDCTFNPNYRQYFENKEKSIKPFGLWIEPILQESTIFLTNIHKSILPQTPPWTIKNPKVILRLNELPKTKAHPSTYQERLHNILQQHPDYIYIFTDGSKDNNKTCAAVLNKIIHKKLFQLKAQSLQLRPVQ